MSEPPDKKPAASAIGLALRTARKRSGLNQREVAAALGLTHVTVSNHERGATRPEDQLIRRYADLYGCSYAELVLGGEVVAYVPGDDFMRVASLSPDSGSWTTVPLPRHLRHLPLAVREYLASFQRRLEKGGATEEEVENAMRLLKSPEVFIYSKGGTEQEADEERVLRSMRNFAEGVIIPDLREQGRKIP